jgi:hypothetical protein
MVDDIKVERQIQFIESLEGDHYHYHVRQFTDWIRKHDRLTAGPLGGPAIWSGGVFGSTSTYRKRKAQVRILSVPLPGAGESWRNLNREVQL